jgi:hypothetical protein
VDESAVIRTQMGKHNRIVMVAVYGTPCAIQPRKQKSTIILIYLIYRPITCKSRFWTPRLSSVAHSLFRAQTRVISGKDVGSHAIISRALM